MEFFISTDNVVEALGILDEITGTHFTGASNESVVSTLLQMDGTSVIATETLAFVDGSRGDYRGEFSDSIVLTKGQKYILQTIIQKDDHKLTARVEVTAKYYRGRGQ